MTSVQGPEEFKSTSLAAASVELKDVAKVSGGGGGSSDALVDNEHHFSLFVRGCGRDAAWFETCDTLCSAAGPVARDVSTGHGGAPRRAAAEELGVGR